MDDVGGLVDERASAQMEMELPVDMQSKAWCRVLLV